MTVDPSGQSRSDRQRRDPLIRLREWFEFVMEEAHVLSTRPGLLFQQAANQPPSTAPAQAALDRLSTRGAPRPWLRRLGPSHELPARNVLMLVGHANDVQALAFSADGTRLASASADHTVRLWDSITGRELQTLIGHTEEVWTCSFLPDGTRLLSASDDGTLRVWDARTGACLACLAGHREGVSTWANSPDGSRIASGSEFGDVTARLWDGLTGAPIAEISGLDGGASKVAFSSDGRRVAAGSVSGRLAVCDGRTGERMVDLVGHEGRITSLSFSPDGRELLSASLDETVRLWNIDTGQGRVLFALHLGRYDRPRCAFLPETDRLIVSGGKRVEIRQVSNAAVIRTIDANWFELAKDKSWLLIGRYDQALRRPVCDLFDPLAENLRASYEASGATAFSPDWQRIAQPIRGGTIQIRAAQPPATDAAPHEVDFCAFSPSGGLCVTAGGLAAVIRDSQTGAMLSRIDDVLPKGSGHLDNTVVFLDDSRLLGKAGKAGLPVHTIWSLPNGERAAVLDQWRQQNIFLSPNRQRVISKMSHEKLAVCDLVTGTTVWSITFEADVEWAAFTADNSRILLVTVPLRVIPFAEPPPAPALIALDGASGRILWSRRLKESGCRVSGISPDGARILAHIGTTDSAWEARDQLVILDATTGQTLVELARHPDSIGDCRFSTNGAWVMGVETCQVSADFNESGSPDGEHTWIYKTRDTFTYRVRLWDAEGGTELGLLASHRRGATAFVFSPDCRYLAIASDEGSLGLPKGISRLEVWNLEIGAPVWEFWPGAQIASLAWSPDGERLLAGSTAGDVHLLRPEPGDVSAKHAG